MASTDLPGYGYALEVPKKRFEKLITTIFSIEKSD